MATVLIIEDEVELVRVLKSYLEQAGLVVLSAHRGDTGLSMYEQKHPDLVILDLNLPGMDGLDVAREIRRKSDTPILILTARVDEIDQLVGLELGADDYITKPFSPRIVVARVRSLLRRSGKTYQTIKMIRLFDLEIDLEAFAIKNWAISSHSHPPSLIYSLEWQSILVGFFLVSSYWRWFRVLHTKDMSAPLMRI